METGFWEISEVFRIKFTKKTRLGFLTSIKRTGKSTNSLSLSIQLAIYNVYRVHTFS